MFCIVNFFLVSGFGTIRQELDANSTAEGEGNVLIQQTSNWLLNEYSNLLDGKKILSPLQSANFINNIEQILKLKFNLRTTEEVLVTESKISFNN